MLARVSRAAWRLEQAERERTWALVSARAEGISIRTLATAIGLSPSRVHQIVADAALDAVIAALGELRAGGWPAPEDPGSDEDADLDGPRSPRRPLAPSSPAAASISSCWQCRARGRGSRFRRQHDGQGSWAVAAKRAAITPVVPAGPDPARWRRSSSAICRWSGQADDQRFSCGPRWPSWPGACPVGSHEVTARRTAGVPSSPPVVPGRRSRLRHRSRMPGSPWSRSRHGRRCPDKETSSRSRRLRG